MKKQKQASKSKNQKKTNFDYRYIEELIRSKDFEEAENKISQHLKNSPNDIIAIKLLANCLLEATPKDFQRTIQLCLSTLKNHSEDTDLMLYAARAYSSAGDLQNAYNMLQKRVKTKPLISSYQLDLGKFLRDIGKKEEAINAFNKSHELDPSSALPLSELSNIHKSQGSMKNAIEFLQQAIELDPNNAKLHNNLATIYIDIRKPSLAVKEFRKSIELNPDNHIYHANLGNVLYNVGKIKEAAEAYSKSIEIKPDNAFSIGQLLHAKRQLCDWSDIDELITKIKHLIANNKASGIAPFVLLSQPELSLEEIHLGTKAFSENHYRKLLSKKPLVDSNNDTRKRNDRLRIGYLSADFHEHATSYLMVGVLEHHDKSNFDIYAYSYGPDDKSPMRTRVKKSFTVFRDIQKMTDEQAANLILKDNIDILVDLKGYTRDMRLGIQALRPAPIIVSWLGYPGTLAVPKLADYIIGDQTVTPIEHNKFYSEKLAIMPHCYQPNDRDRVIKKGITRKDEGLPEDKFIFCSFNQTYKITPFMFDQWCEILKRVENSILWILEPRDDSSKSNLIDEAIKRGIAEDRIYFAKKRPQAEHLGRLHLGDLALDTLPYTSHTTASDALWVGLPLVTLIGETFPARVAASILKTMGVPELITETPEKFISLATELANNSKQLSNIKDKILKNRLASPLYNTEIFARNMEKLYVNMWKRHAKTTIYSGASSELSEAMNDYFKGNKNNAYQKLLNVLNADPNNTDAKKLIAFMLPDKLSYHNKTQLIFGLGTGRSGSTSLTGILQSIPKTYCSHEHRPIVNWSGDFNTVNWQLDRMHALSVNYQLVGDVSHWWLPYTEYILSKFPNTLFIAIQRSKQDTVKSFTKIMGGERKGSVNHWVDHDGTHYQKNRWDSTFPSYKVKGLKTALNRYWDDYYEQCEKLKRKYPDNFFLLEIEQLSDSQAIKEILNKRGINVPVKETYKILNKGTTADGAAMIPIPLLN